MTLHPSEVLDFWFEGDLTVRRQKWFEKNDAFDQDCARFIPHIRAARDGRHDSWAETPTGTPEGAPEGALALIILMDQLSRNAFRGQAEAFAADPHALAIARASVTRGLDMALTPFQRMFVYLPFEHAENLEDQDTSVRLFEGVRAELGGDTVDYAHRHRAVIAQFGRFPHRNAILGRASTAAEEAYLAQPGSGF